jgi:DNA-binding CsgD family transcriptional regulator
MTSKGQLGLGNGHSMKQYSEESGVTHNTARTHFSSVFAKTRMSRQSELVRLVQGLRTLRR